MSLIYIVEDDKNICEIEAYTLTNVGYEVRELACADELYTALQLQTPDLILLDIMLPDEDGLSIVKKLRSQSGYKEIPIIIVTAKTTEIDKGKGLDLGADDYMTKPFGVMELISRVKALLRRSSKTLQEEALQIGKITLVQTTHTVMVADQVCDLTYKEYELLKFLMHNAGIVATRGLLMDRVWGVDFEGESRTLDMHIRNLRQKLQEEGKRIKTIRNVGDILER